MTDFYGAQSQADIVPGSILFGDVIVSGVIFGVTNNQTVSGLGTGVTIDLSVSQTGAGQPALVVNGINQGSIATVTNGDLIAVEVTTLPPNMATGIVTVSNVTDSNTVLDTFLYDIDGGSGGGI